MARLTWQNVDAPDLGRAADILNNAALQVGAGATGIGSAARGFREDQMDRRSAAALPILAGIQGSGDVQGALAQIGSVLRPEDMDEETRKAYLGLMGQGIEYDATRAGTASMVGQEGRSAADHSRKVAKDDELRRLAPYYAKDRAAAFGGEGGSGGTGGEWLKYSNQGAVRDKPLAPGLVDAMSFLGDMGITMDVVSGGEVPGKTASDSGRHLHGNAGDVDFYKDGRKLVPSNPEDLVILNQIVQTAKSRGVTSFGEGDDYMGAGRVHLGYGNPGTWGANGKGANTPEWLRSAYNGAPSFLGQIGEGTWLTPDDIDTTMTSYEEGLTSRDEDRDRDFKFDNSAYDEDRRRRDIARSDEVQASARELAELALKGSVLPGDQAAFIGKADYPIEVKNLALAALQGEGAQAKYDLPFGTPTPKLEGASIAATTLDVANSAIKNEKNNDPQLRIQSNAASFGSETTVEIAEKLGLTTEDGKGWWAAKVEDLMANAKDAQGNKISLTPGEASSLLLESAGYADFFTSGILPFGEEWGDTYANTDKALGLAAQYMSTEQKRAGAEKLSQIGQAESSAAALREELSTIAQGMAQASYDGNEKEEARFQKMWEEKVQRVKEFEGGLPFLPKRGAGGDGEGGGAPETGGDGTTPTPTTTPDPVAAAAAQAADDAIQTATNGTVDLETLSSQPPEVQAQLLDQAIRELQTKGGSQDQIAILEQLLEEAIYEVKAPDRVAATPVVKEAFGAGIRSVMDPLGQAAIRVADSALQSASEGMGYSKMDFKRLRRASPDAQAEVLTQFIQQLKNNGGTPTEIEVLENLLSQAMSGGISDQ